MTDQPHAIELVRHRGDHPTAICPNCGIAQCVQFPADALY